MIPYVFSILPRISSISLSFKRPFIFQQQIVKQLSASENVWAKVCVMGPSVPKIREELLPPEGLRDFLISHWFPESPIEYKMSLQEGFELFINSPAGDSSFPQDRA